MKNKAENSEKINAEITRYREPWTIKWKFVDQNDFHINKKYGLMNRKAQRLKRLNEHLNYLSKNIEKRQSNIVLANQIEKYCRDSIMKDDVDVIKSSTK